MPDPTQLDSVLASAADFLYRQGVGEGATAVDDARRQLAQPLLTEPERHLLGVCVDRYITDIRTACAEDQGTADGQPGTVGRIMQEDLRRLKERLSS